MLIRPYDAARDEGVVYALWQAALGHVWPLSRATFQHITVPVAVYRPGDHVVAQHNGVPVGFAATQTLQVPAEPIPRGELMVVLVHPAYQGQGLGRALLERALDVLRQRGVAEARLGGGGLSYFWPGVPANVPGAWAFFEACGWTVSERSFDLAMNLNGYRTPAWVGAGIRLPDVTVCTAKPGEEQTLPAFEAEHFPAWLQFYRESVAGGRIADVILAHHPRHGILGTCGLLPPNRQMPRPWQPGRPSCCWIAAPVTAMSAGPGW